MGIQEFSKICTTFTAGEHVWMYGGLHTEIFWIKDLRISWQRFHSKGSKRQADKQPSGKVSNIIIKESFVHSIHKVLLNTYHKILSLL